MSEKFVEMAWEHGTEGIGNSNPMQPAPLAEREVYRFSPDFCWATGRSALSVSSSAISFAQTLRSRLVANGASRSE